MIYRFNMDEEDYINIVKDDDGNITLIED